MNKVLLKNNYFPNLPKYELCWRVKERAILGLILVIALILRVYGIDFGLPYLYDPDESTFVDPALRMVWHGDLNPGWFGHPGTTVIYINALIYEFINVTGRLVGWFSDYVGFRSFYFNDPTLFYLLPRIFYAVFSTFTVFLVYLVGRVVYGGIPALVAAFSLTVSPLYISYSQLVRTDVLASGLILLVGYFSLRIVRARNIDAYLWAGVFTGISVATKYPSVVASIMVVFSHFISSANRFRESWKLLATAICAVIALFISTPYLFLDYLTALNNVQGEARTTHLGATGGGFIENLWWYFNYPLALSVGWPALCLSLLAVVIALKERQKDALSLVVFVVVFLTFISALSLRWERWVIPVLPFFAILMAGGLKVIFDAVQIYWPKIPKYGLIYLASLLTLLPVIYATTQQMNKHTLPDTRTVARDWILNNIPKHSRLLIESYGPQLPRGNYQLFDVVGGGFEASSQVIRPSPMSRMGNVIPGWNIVGNLDVAKELPDNGIEYIVITNYYERYQLESMRYSKNIKNYERLFSIAKLVHEIEPNNETMQGPHIRVYRSNTAATYK